MREAILAVAACSLAVTALVATAQPYAGNRDISVFVDADEEGLRKVALTGYAEESVHRFFEGPG